MLQDEQDAGNEETDFRIKKLLSWQNVLSNRQVAANIEEKWANHKWGYLYFLKLNSLLRGLASYKVLKTS